MAEFKGAFGGCHWCHGNGCLQCADERRKAEERAMQPILSCTLEEMNDPETGPIIKQAVHADALLKAFGPGGGGIREVEENCAIASLLLELRRRRAKEDEQP